MQSISVDKWRKVWYNMDMKERRTKKITADMYFKSRRRWEMNPVERIHGKPKGYKRERKDWSQDAGSDNE